MSDKDRKQDQKNDGTEVPLEYCRTAPSAEHARGENEDQPCYDYRAETFPDSPEGATGFAPRKGDALVAVDIQNDFLRGGSLEVEGGEEVVPVLNRYMKLFEEKQLPIIATRDWHPEDHSSFKAQGGPWPPHCVQGTKGSAFAPGFHLPGSATIVSTGSVAEKEGYSGFEEDSLKVLLESAGVSRLWIGGLATDYCVRHTALDALRRGYKVVLLEDAIRAVDVNPGDGQAAIDEMKSQGAVLASLSTVAGGQDV